MTYTEPAHKRQLVLCPNCNKPSTFTDHIKNNYFDKTVCDNCGYTLKAGKAMEIYERCYYEQKCDKCGKKAFALSQHDNSPEYHTEVGIEHKCGNIVWFSLPVN